MKKDLSDNAPDIGEERTQVNEAMVDDIFLNQRKMKIKTPK